MVQIVDFTERKSQVESRRGKTPRSGGPMRSRLDFRVLAVVSTLALLFIAPRAQGKSYRSQAAKWNNARVVGCNRAGMPCSTSKVALPDSGARKSGAASQELSRLEQQALRPVSGRIASSHSVSSRRSPVSVPQRTSSINFSYHAVRTASSGRRSR